MPDIINSFAGQYAFLSNFWNSPLIYQGKYYPTAEHAFQAAKAQDDAHRAYVGAAKTPGEAKKRGRGVPLRADWESVKQQVMEDVLRAKFADPDLRRQLLATGNQLLVEGNTWGDQEWGVVNGVGKNLLGQLLMKLRSEYERP